MLAIIRDRASGWIVGIIVGALIISFAFWGVSFYFGDGPELSVAKVNDKNITQREFQRSFYNLRQRIQSIFGETASLEEEKLIKDQALEELINTEIVNQIVEEEGLRITDANVVDTIKNLDVFKDDEGFDRGKYERGIINLGMEPTFFEGQLRMDLLAEQLQAGLSESVFIPETELKNILQLGSQTRDITYTLISIDSLLENIEIEDSEPETFYRINSNKYLEPEKIKIAYLELNIDGLIEAVETDEETLRAYYNDNKDKYDVVEQRSVTKLSVKIAEENADKEIIQKSDEVKAKARGVIEAALDLVKEGNTFEEVVEQFTEEGGGALEFSEHAFMSKGIMDKEVDEFLFSADENGISEIIKTETSLNIVRVGEIRGGPENNYETAMQQVEKDYREEQARLQFFELQDQLTNLTYEHPDTLEVAAEAIGQDIIESDYFSRDSDEEGITSEAKIISNSFDPGLISSGQNSDAIELADNHIVVLRVLEHQPAVVKPLEEVRDDVMGDLRLEKASEKIKQLGEDIVQQLQSGTSYDAVSSDVGLEWSTAEKVKRDDISINRAILRNAFQSGKPEGGKPVVSGRALGGGDYAVVMVTATYVGELDFEDNNLLQTTGKELKRARGNNEWRGFLNNARSNLKIILYEENI